MKINKNNAEEIITISYGATKMNPIFIFKLIKYVMHIPNMMFWSDLEKFVEGVGFTEEKRHKLATNIGEKNYSDFADRIIRVLYQNDAEKKNQYYINLTYVLVENIIKLEDYYRALDAIKSTLYEDLQYLITNIRSDFEITGTIYTRGLEKSGLMRSKSMYDSGNTYIFTLLALFVDKYALSFNKKNYKYNDDLPNLTEEDKSGTATGTTWKESEW
jgi:hypothetical protein